LAWLGREFVSNDEGGLSQLKRNPALQVVYPGSEQLLYKERPAQSFPLEGVHLGPKIEIFYGVKATDSDISEFYRRRLQGLAWTFAGVSTGSLYTYERFGFIKGELGLDIAIWFKEDFKRQYGIDADDYQTVYEVVIVGPQ
jgi:hypothetical protein